VAETDQSRVGMLVGRSGACAGGRPILTRARLHSRFFPAKDHGSTFLRQGICENAHHARASKIFSEADVQKYGNKDEFIIACALNLGAATPGNR